MGGKQSLPHWSLLSYGFYHSIVLYFLLFIGSHVLCCFHVCVICLPTTWFTPALAYSWVHKGQTDGFEWHIRAHLLSLGDACKLPFSEALSNLRWAI